MILNPPRSLAKEEYVFWHQALNRCCDVGECGPRALPEEVKRLANREASSYDKLWVEFNWETGSDPALFGERNGQTYLLARWGTDAYPLRTEEQIMLSYRRHVENEAEHYNGIFQAWWFVFEFIFAYAVVGGMMNHGWDINEAAILAIVFLLELSRRWHKKRGLTTPNNIWEKRALAFIKHKQTAST